MVKSWFSRLHESYNGEGFGETVESAMLDEIYDLRAIVIRQQRDINKAKKHLIMTEMKKIK